MTYSSKLFYLFVFLLPANTATAQVNLKEGLVAYYPFNGTTNDESGNRNNPSVASVTFAPDRFGSKNSACAFDGRSNYLRIPNHPSLNFRKGFSMSVWVMARGFYEGKCHGNRILMKGDADYLKGSYMLTFDDNRSSNGNNCYVEKTDKARQSFYGAFASPVTNDYIAPGKWYLLTYTYDGTNALLYVNCKLQAKGVLKNYDFSNSYDLYLGKMNNSQYPYWFNGLMDEVRLYNRVLKNSEISALCALMPEKAKTGCDGKDIVPATFGYTVKNCNTVSFNLNAFASNNLKTVQWYFGDGGTAGKTSTVHTYTKYGKYTVKVITISKAGCADTATREIILTQLNSDFSYSETGEPGNIQFKAKNKNESYIWSFDNGKKNEFAPTYQFNESGLYTVQLIVENNIGCKDTIKKQINVELPPSITKVPIDKQTSKTPVAPKSPELKLEKRAANLIENVIVENESISISIYDNGIVDGDSVTLIYNNEIIADHQLLSNKPITFTIKVDRKRSNNELLMYAENLGSIPPNTALLIINDGGRKHSINLSSSKSSNGIISFTLKQR